MVATVATSCAKARREYKVGRDFSASRIAEIIPNIVAIRTDLRNAIFSEWA